MIVTSTLAIRTAFASRLIAFLGYALSLPLLFGIRLIDWGFLVFPGWVLLLSLYILIDNLRRPSHGATGGQKPVDEAPRATSTSPGRPTSCT
jgi:hypothetical protein